MSVQTGIGARLRGARGQMTQAEFAGRLGVHRKTVERWESGERIPDGESLLGLKREFGVDPGWLLTGEGDRPSASTLTPDEAELLALFRAAPLAVKAAAIGALQGGTARPTTRDQYEGSKQIFKGDVGEVTGRDLVKLNRKRRE